MAKRQRFSANIEDYLECIFKLVQENRVARSKGIAERLGVNRSSVSGMIQNLAERGLVEHERYGYITLTAAGSKIAREVARRHDALREFFVQVLKIDETEADEAACRMEHAVSKRVLERLTTFAHFIETRPDGVGEWSDELGKLFE